MLRQPVRLLGYVSRISIHHFTKNHGDKLHERYTVRPYFSKLWAWPRWSRRSGLQLCEICPYHASTCILNTTCSSNYIISPFYITKDNVLRSVFSCKNMLTCVVACILFLYADSYVEKCKCNFRLKRKKKSNFYRFLGSFLSLVSVVSAFRNIVFEFWCEFTTEFLPLHFLLRKHTLFADSSDLAYY